LVDKKGSLLGNRWFLGTAIKSWLRAGPYPDTRKQKDAAPKTTEGLPEKEEKLMRRTIALFTAMAMMVLVAASVALAATVTCPVATSSSIFCNGTIGDDTMTGTDRTYTISDGVDSISWGDKIFGSGGNDTLNALGGPDDLNGGPGTDKLDGGAGDDRYLFTGSWGVDTITADASGNDSIVFSLASTQALVVDLVASSFRDEAKSGTNTLNLGVTRFPIIENVIGGVENDTFYGTLVSNSLSGNGGNDKLNGRSGDDSLLGGDGDDELHGLFGRDFFYGGSGNDKINADDNAADGAISCGSGWDTVYYDRGLEVPASDCEKIISF
jgi:Ca2+-binding RTX toxin-like protein